MNQTCYYVKATFDSIESLAWFQHLEWAIEWRDKMCATGIIFEVSSKEIAAPNEGRKS